MRIIKGVSEEKDLVWEERKKKYIESVKNGGEDVWAVSIADKIHNVESLMVFYSEHGPDTWGKFSRPKEKKIWFEDEMLKMFQENWQHPLVDEYGVLVEKMKKLD